MVEPRRYAREHDAVAIADAESSNERSCRGAIEIGEVPHQRDAPVVGRLGRRDDGLSLADPIERPIQDRLRTSGGNLFQRLSAPCRNEKEKTPALRADLLDDTMNVGEIVHRLVRHQRVDLQGDSRIGDRAREVQGARIGAHDAAELVVAYRRRSVETERHCGDAHRGERLDHRRCQQWRDARRHVARQAERDGVLDDVEEIVALQGVATRENHMRRGLSGELVEDSEYLGCPQFLWIRARVGIRAAVVTREIARAGELPVDSLRGIIEKKRHGPLCCNRGTCCFGWDSLGTEIATNSDMRPVCVIVGGGISGLAAAYELHASKVPFLLVESAHRFGGLIRTETIDEFVIDAGPDAILTQKPGGVALCRTLGVELSPVKSPGTFIARRDALRLLPEAGMFGIPTDWRGFARTRAFSTVGKFRMAAEYFLPPLRPAPARNDESIASFVARRFGLEAMETIGEPLMAGIHGGSAARLSMRALFPRVLDFEQRDGSVIRGIRRARRHSGAQQSPFASVRGGTEALVTALVDAMPRESLIRGIEVRAIERASHWRIHLSNGDCLQAPAVLIATPPRVVKRLLVDAEPVLSELCGRVRDVSLVTVSLGYDKRAVRHPLAGSGFVVPASERAHVTAVTWIRPKWPDRAPAECVLLRAFLGGARDAGAIDRSDTELIGSVRDDFRRYPADYRSTQVARVFRWPHAGPQLDVGHLELMDGVSARLHDTPGLFLSAAGFRGVGIADCVADARAQAAAAAAYCAAQTVREARRG